MQFVFPQVRFLDGSLSGIESDIPRDATVLVVTSVGGAGRGYPKLIERTIARAGGDVRKVRVESSARSNPTLQQLTELTAKWADSQVDIIVGLGGGSVLDTAKVLGVTLPLGSASLGQLAEALQTGEMGPWSDRLPVISIPTVAGSGAEVTPFATIWDADRKTKLSLGGVELMPTTVGLAPALARTLPRRDALTSALDCLSHALESVWNKNRTPVTLALSSRALVLLVNCWPKILEQWESDVGDSARRDLASASLLAGLAISTTKTAVCHAVSYALTSQYAVPHGLASSCTLEEVLRQNRGVIRERLQLDGLESSILDLLSRTQPAKLVREYIGVDQWQRLRSLAPNRERLANFDGELAFEPSELVIRALGR